MSEKEQDFEMTISSNTSDDEIVVTSITDLSEKWLSAAMNTYDSSNRQYSAYLKDGQSPSTNITPEYLDELAENAQNDLKKIQTINSIIRKQINKNDIVGKTVESIETNINTEIKLSYDVDVDGRNKNKQLEKNKLFIKNFNEEVNIKKLVRNSVSTSYAEGNYIMYLRNNGEGNYLIDYYPLGVCEISDYNINGEPVVFFNIQELRNRLQKTYKKNKKNKPLFFKNIEEEVKANYPKEVYDAFIAKEQYAKLNSIYTGVIRIGNLNRKYGLSPIYRALNPLLMLETFDNSDRINSKAKSKKIIHQKLRKEVMGNDHNKKGFEEMSYAHANFMSAFKMPTVVVTTPPSVENIQYIEPTVEMTDVKTVNNYRSRVLATLGIGFLMDSNSQSVSTASISITQLMRTINKISEQLEYILNRWYKQILIDNRLNAELCPTIKIIDSEQIEMDIKKELATMLYSTFNCSLETSLEILGVDINDEIAKRKSENDKELNQIFFPRATSYTTSDSQNENQGGNPRESKDDNKESYDESYNKTR